MIKQMLVLTCILLMLSCNKDESDDLLTNGSWIVDNGIISTVSERLTFSSNGTYIIESSLTNMLRINTVKATISGDYMRQADTICFLTTILDLPDDTTLIGVPYENGQPICNFFGYTNYGVFQYDSSLIDSIVSISFTELRDSDIFQSENEGIRTWIIESLTNDTLKVKTEIGIVTYFKEN